MALIDEVKTELSVSGDDFNVSIQGLIDAVKLEMESKGLDKTKIVDTDPLVKQAIILYCKANFRYGDVQMAERFQNRYDMTLNHMLISGMYKVVTV